MPTLRSTPSEPRPPSSCGRRPPAPRPPPDRAPRPLSSPSLRSAHRLSTAAGSVRARGTTLRGGVQEGLMLDTAMTCSEPETVAPAPHTDGGHLWAIVLAGGEGVRLQPLTRELYGEPRPKQFAALTGHATLLRQTLD